ncbi:MAG: hypothetical protein KGZ50_03040 [Peptococcaceae bacterium]|nr:hypothetical protein [Peptococcaceae bacterium]
MATFGPAIFSDDLASDVRADYLAELAAGTTNEESTRIVIEKHSDVKDTAEEPVFWFALALTQWNKGRLLEHVKEQALAFIEKDLLRWNRPGNERNYEKRAAELEKLKQTLQSPVPEAKKVRKPSWLWKSPWPTGALLAYKITHQNTPVDFKEKYVLWRVLQVRQYLSQGYTGEDIRVGLYNWVGDQVPDAGIVGGLEYIDMDKSVESDPFLGKLHFRTQFTTFTRQDIKNHDITCIAIDDSYKDGLPEFFKDHKEPYAFCVPG